MPEWGNTLHQQTLVFTLNLISLTTSLYQIFLMFGEVRPVHELWDHYTNSQTSASIWDMFSNSETSAPILRPGSTKSVEIWETRLDLAALPYLALPVLKYYTWVLGEIRVIPEIWRTLCKLFADAVGWFAEEWFHVKSLRKTPPCFFQSIGPLGRCSFQSSKWISISRKWGFKNQRNNYE